MYEHLGTPYRAFISGFPYVWLRAAAMWAWPDGPEALSLIHI